MPFAALLMRPIVIISIALMLSVAANVGLYKLWIHEVKQVGEEKARTAQASADAKTCSDGVAKLKQESDARIKKAEALAAVARKQREAVEKEAEKLLQTPPAIPQDVCASALELSRRMHKERKP